MRRESEASCRELHVVQEPDGSQDSLSGRFIDIRKWQGSRERSKHTRSRDGRSDVTVAARHPLGASEERVEQHSHLSLIDASVDSRRVCGTLSFVFIPNRDVLATRL